MNNYQELMNTAEDIASVMRGETCVHEITDCIVGMCATSLSSKEYDFVEREVFRMLSVSPMTAEHYEEMMMYGDDY